MHWTLCRAACTCGWRGAREALRARPVVGGLLLAAVLALPLLAVVAGEVAAPVLRAAATDDTLATALAVAAVAAFASIGIAVAMLASDRAFLGRQLEAAPLGRAESFAGLTLLPLMAFGAPCLAIVAAFSLTATRGAGGVPVAFAIVIGATSAVALGAASAAGIAAAVRGSVVGVAALACLAAVWLAVGTVGGSARLGPASAVALSVRDPTQAIGALGAATLAGFGLWALAALVRPSERPLRADVRLTAPSSRRPLVATALATLLRLARNAQLRRHVVAGTVFAVGGALGIRAVVGADVAPYFAAFVALVVAAACPLVATGLRRDAAWLLRVVPVTGTRLAAADACAAVVAGFAVVMLIVALAAPLGPLSASALLIVEVNAALVLGAAAASSALAPWRADRMLEQLSSYAVLAVVAAFLTAALGRASDVATSTGVPETLFAAAAAHAVLLSGIALAAVLEE